MAIDHALPHFATALPVSANVVAGILLAPAEFYALTILFGIWQARQERRRWQHVASELATALEGRWESLRALLAYQLSLADDDALTAAERAWEDLRRQEEAQPLEVSGSEAAVWTIPPAESLEAIDRIQVIWMRMWPAGLERDLDAWQSRLTRILLPRLGLDDPALVSASRLLIDALDDYKDATDTLEDWENPFPDRPFLSESESATGEHPVIPHGAPAGALQALAELRRAFAAIGTAVERGDHLTRLIEEQRGGHGSATARPVR